MKLNKTLQQCIPSVLFSLILACSTSLCLAADISYTFDSDVQGWSAADGHGSVAWSGTNGRGGGGCLQYTIVGGVDSEVDPRVDVAFDTTGYFSVEFDIMVDPSSGTDANGSYGNLQIVARDASWSWDSIWFGAVGNSFNTYQHVKRAFTSAYGTKAHLQIQFAASAAPYSTNVIVYIDNVVIRDGTPPNKAMMFDFAWPEETTMGVSSWGGGGGAVVVSQDTSAAPLHPDGSLKMAATYAGGGAWQETDVQLSTYDWDPSKFTYLDFDLYLDAPAGLSTYGGFSIFQITSSWGWQWVAGPGLSAANIGTWTHFSSIPLSSMTVSHGIIFQAGGGFTSASALTYYVDNVKLWKPATPPAIKKLVKGSGVGGVQITMDQDGSQWQRDAMATPSGGGPYFWTSQGSYPVSYSFTITNFPNAAAHGGFEAHMYLVNGDTDAGTWDQTYGGCDWNSADILQFRVENAAAGGVIAHIDWKTNLPGANPLANAMYHPVAVNGPTAIGTWKLTFTDSTSGTVTGPGITATNFTLPAEAVANNFSPSLSYIQFGMFKNDGANDGHNNQAHGTFSDVEVTVNGNAILQDNFPGPGLTANNAWRTTSSTAVLWVPPDIAYWLTWTLPDDGFELYVAGTVNGPYVDAGVGAANGFTFLQGAARTGGVPAANMPAGNAAFFQLKKQ